VRYSSTPGHGSRAEKGEHRAAMDLLPGLPTAWGCISSCHGRREASVGCSGRVCGYSTKEVRFCAQTQRLLFL
jgi:hypothetical protein